VLAAVNFLHEFLSHFAAYRGLYERHSFYVPEGIDKLSGVVMCAFAVWTLRKLDWQQITCELGLTASPLPSLAFALVASSPMLVGFAVTRGVTPHMRTVTILFLTVLSPIVEEIEFRGLGVRNLQRGTGWPFWAIVWPQALLFGWGHVEQGQSFADMVGLMLLTGSGAVVFGWLVYRWQSLWCFHCSACLHEPVVGSVQRLQDCLGWMVPIHPANGVHLVRRWDHPLLDQGTKRSPTVADLQSVRVQY